MHFNPRIFSAVFIGILVTLSLAACQKSTPETGLLATEGPGLYVTGNTNHLLDEKTQSQGLLRHFARIETSDGKVCSGVLIHSRMVVTAAHCLNSPSDYQLSFVADRSGLRRETIKVAPRFVKAHPKGLLNTYTYKEVSENSFIDLAVIFLPRAPRWAKPAPVGIFEVLPAKYREQILDYKSLGIVRDESLNVTHLWGQISATRATRIKESDYYTLTHLHTHQLCRGDSGGPTFSKVLGEHILVGVNAFTIGEGSQILESGKRVTVCTDQSGLLSIGRFANFLLESLADYRTSVNGDFELDIDFVQL